MCRRRNKVAVPLLCLLFGCDSGGFSSHADAGPTMPAKLTFTTQPAHAMAGAAIGPVAVAVQDTYGNTVAGASTSITVAIGTNTANGSLSGTTTVTAVSGVAVFSNLVLDKSGAGYTLTAGAAGLRAATSNPFDVSAAPRKLGFAVQPTTIVVGHLIKPAVQVTVQDENGNLVAAATRNVTLAIGTNPASGVLSGTTTVPAVNGAAAFSNLSIGTPGTGYALTAYAAGLTGTTSSPFDVTVAPRKLAFRLQPTTTVVNRAIAPAIAVVVLDETGNVVSTSNDSVTMAIKTGPAAGTLSGTLTVAAVDGVATFTDLNLDTGGTGYTLWASAYGLDGATSEQFAITPHPLVFTGVSAGEFHTCGVTTDNLAFCWGANYYGQLGNGPGEVVPGSDSVSPVPVVNYTGLPDLSFTRVSANGGHSCGVTTASEAYCWGYGPNGAGGSGLTPHPQGPAHDLNYVTVKFAAVSAGGNSVEPGDFLAAHTCGVTPAGAAYCYGANAFGELGDGSTTDWMMAMAVAGGLSFAAVSGGGEETAGPYTCGVTTASAAYCWGANSSGQLGDGSTTGRMTPVAVAGGLGFAVVSAGGDHACGVTTTHAAYCWGDNSFGQLGDGALTRQTTPVAVSGQLDFATVSAGLDHSCGVTTAGSAYCWGDNSSGQLGDGSTTSRTSPVAVQGKLNFSAVSAGGSHTCGLTPDGVAYCWGDNSYGQLGAPTTGRSSVPVKVSDQP